MNVMKKVKVVSVIVTYNAYKGGFFPRCLEHLDLIELKNDQFEIDHHIIVVDSASSDQTPEKIKQSHSQIQVIASEKNLGYAGGNNLGFEEAQKMGADYIAIITQDVYIKPQWLLEALKVAESDKSIGIVQPLLLLWPQRDRINSTGNAIHFLGYGYARGYQDSLVDYRNSGIEEIPYSSGAVFLYSMNAYRAIGGFDEEMWMYNEDQDLGWRLLLAGYKSVLAPNSRAYHQYEFSRSITKMYYMDRNRLIVIFQNYHIATLLIIFKALFLNELAGFVLAWRGGWLKEKLAVWKYFLKPQSWKLILQKRRLRQANRVVKDKDLIKHFTGQILFQDVMNPLIKYLANPILGLYYWVVKLIIFW